MTVTPLVRLGTAMLALSAGAALAQQQPRMNPPASSRPSYQQTSRDQQVRDQVRKNQVEEQLRQDRNAVQQRANASGTQQQRMQQQQDDAARQGYRARQQDAVDRAQDAPTTAHSGG